MLNNTCFIVFLKGPATKRQRPSIVQGGAKEAPGRRQGGAKEAPRRVRRASCTPPGPLGRNNYQRLQHTTQNGRTVERTGHIEQGTSNKTKRTCVDLTRPGPLARRRIRVVVVAVVVGLKLILVVVEVVVVSSSSTSSSS